MAVKLHRCSLLWVKLRGHPCWRVQKALDESGTEYELVKEGSSFKSSNRQQTLEKTGQKKWPWIEFEDGSVYRADSKDMVETIRAGKLNEQRQTT
jgi:glutathione S-transferase